MEINFKQRLNHITCFVFDVDGVLTDGSLLVTEEGNMLRTMHIRDGFALKAAAEKGYPVFIISGSSSEGVRIRLNRLGISEIHMKVEDKSKLLDQLLTKYKINHSQVLYMGDDVPDLKVLKTVGVPTCPADAMPEIKKVCIYISENPGGHGSVRDVIEQVMRLQGKWELIGYSNGFKLYIYVINTHVFSLH